jgi:F0F1-type ATP synthase assembly protein I
MSEDERRISDTHNAAWSITSYLLSGMLVWGGVGWLLDRWTHHEAVFFPIGLVVGIVAALYLVHIRYDKPSDHSSDHPRDQP